MIEAIDQQRNAVAALCQSTGALRLAAFGSAVREDFDPEHSDLDFLVASDDLPLARYADAYFALKAGLETLFGCPVDLITDSSLANPYFRAQVTAEARTLYAR